MSQLAPLRAPTETRLRSWRSPTSGAPRCCPSMHLNQPLDIFHAVPDGPIAEIYGRQLAIGGQLSNRSRLYVEQLSNVTQCEQGLHCGLSHYAYLCDPSL